MYWQPVHFSATYTVFVAGIIKELTVINSLLLKISFATLLKFRSNTGLRAILFLEGRNTTNKGRTLTTNQITLQ